MKRDAGPRAALPVRKRLLFSALTVALLLLVLELGLAVIGVRPILYDEDPYVGFSGGVPLFVEAGGGGDPTLVTSPGKLAWFNLQRFARRKSAAAYRVFCLGGSTTHGQPYDDTTSFCGWLRELLREADDRREWEVINAGGISYASYRVATLMEELVRYEPDLFIIYTGHNEFLEKRTYASIIDTPPVIRGLDSILSATRLYSALRRLVHGSAGKAPGAASGRWELPAEVDTLLDNAVGTDAYTRDDDQKQRILAHFRFNLSRMVDIARAAGAEVVFVTPASNVRDFSPFKSEHRAGLTVAERTRWQELYRAAENAQAAGQPGEALRLVEEAAAIDDRHAGLHFRRGRVLLDLSRPEEARAAFLRARDEDVCPLRALSSVERLVTEVATDRAAPLVDFVALVAERSEHAIPGDNLFLDHVHPTIEGHRLLALSLLEKLVALGIVDPLDSWGEEAIGKVRDRVEGRVDRVAHATALRNLAKVLGWAGKVEAADGVALRALELLPSGTDANAHYLAGMAFERRGELGKAAANHEAALRIAPEYADAHCGLGTVLRQEGQLQKAAAHLEQAIRLDSRLADAHLGLGLFFEQEGDLTRARASYENALGTRPGFARALNNLGGVLQKQGDLSAAEATYQRALAVQPDLAEAHANLGTLLARRGELVEATRHLEEAIRLQPSLAKAHSDLGTLLGRQGNVPRARALLEEAIRLEPDLAEAHNNLGLLLVEEGELREASAHFEQALRARPDYTRARDNLERVRAALAGKKSR